MIETRISHRAVRLSCTVAVATLALGLGGCKEDLSDLVATFDRHGCILFLNQAGRSLLGFGLDDDLSRRSVADLFPLSDLGAVIDGTACAGGPGLIRHDESTLIAADGRILTVEQRVLLHAFEARQQLEREVLARHRRDGEEPPALLAHPR